MTERAHSGRLVASMLYLLAIAMFVAACIIGVGYAGRGPREEQERRDQKNPELPATGGRFPKRIS